MKRKSSGKETQSLIIAVIISFSFVILAFTSTIPWSELSQVNNQPSAFAGTQEAVDITSKPRTTATPTISPTPSPTLSFIDDGFDDIPTATAASVSSSPFSFENNFGGDDSTEQSPSPLPTFQLNLPGEGATDTEPSPTQATTTVVQNNNTPIIILGVVIGVAILLAIIGFVLIKKSRDNTPPPSFPGGPAGFPPNPQTSDASQNPANYSNEPQYPPYINQQS